MTVHRRPSAPRLSRPLLVALISLLLVALAALAVSARTWLVPRPSARPSGSATASPSPQEARRRRSNLDAEIITITPRGFEPAEITRPAGPFILVVDNQSGLDEITFLVEREGGGRTHEVRVPREQVDWDGVVDLPVGTYLVTEAAHPDWLCRVTITSQ